MTTSNAYYHSKLGVRFYDLFTGDAGRTGPVKGDVDFYLACAQQFGGPILEAGVGTGRVLWPLAAAGFHITGIDLSSDMLTIARANGERESASTRDRVRLHQMDMTSFDLKESFMLAIVPFRAFQHLTLAEQPRRALECIKRCLAPGGHLVVDLFDPRLEYCIQDAPALMPIKRVEDPTTGHTVIRRVVNRVGDPMHQVITEHFLFEEVDSTGRVVDSEETEWSLRWATRHEMHYLFELIGLEVIAEYSDFLRSPPAYGTEQVWLVRKTKG